MREITDGTGARSSAARNLVAAAMYLSVALILVLLEVNVGQSDAWKWLFVVATAALLLFLVYPVLTQPTGSKAKLVALMGRTALFLLIVLVTIVVGVNVKFLLGGTI
jgi:hypothetical protein